MYGCPCVMRVGSARGRCDAGGSQVARPWWGPGGQEPCLRRAVCFPVRGRFGSTARRWWMLSIASPNSRSAAIWIGDFLTVAGLSSPVLCPFVVSRDGREDLASSNASGSPADHDLPIGRSAVIAAAAADLARRAWRRADMLLLDEPMNALTPSPRCSTSCARFQGGKTIVAAPTRTNSRDFDE